MSSPNINISPGIHPSDLCQHLDDRQIAILLPPGAFRLASLLAPDQLHGSERARALGKMISLELAIDDHRRRLLLLDALPTTKVDELEDRLGTSIDLLQQTNRLAPSVRRALLGFFGLALAPSNPTTPSPSVASVAPSHSLFPHQKRAAIAVERFLYTEDGRAMLHLPTGVGKTRTAMSIIASHLRNQSTGLVVWLATTRELLEQAASEFESTWSTVGDRPVDCLRYWSSYAPPIDRVSDGIVFASLAKLHSYGKRRERLWNLGDRTTMVVFDEAHQAVAPTYQDIVETLVTRKPRIPLLGLTATPGRTWGDPDVDLAVSALFYGNKVMIDLGTPNPIRTLTDNGYLARVDFSLLNVSPGLQLSMADLNHISRSLDLPAPIAKQLGDDQQRNLRIVQRLLELLDQHSRILVFAASVSNALILTSICRGIGLNADAITGQTDPRERESSIRRFRRPGKPHRILINYQVLTAGFDAPAASAALIARPTKSLVLYSQMIGRVMRGPRAGGTSHCEVVTVVDTALPGFRDVAEAFMNWEDVWDAP